jgi:SOS-response transcriptional repressor LexA
MQVVLNKVTLYKMPDDSMSGDRIMKGDIIMIEKISEISPRDIVLVNHDKLEYPTLRRMEKQKDGYLLIPSNPFFPKQNFCGITLIGKVSGFKIAH